MRLIENYVARAEQLLNPVDWVPYAASFSGMIRILAGGVEVHAAVAYTAVKIVEILLTGRGRYFNAFVKGFNYALHGLGNILRGAIAMLPWVNLALFFHDNYLGRMNYPEETMRKNVYPIMTAYRLV